MQTIEFDSYVENGVITVPLKYQKIITRLVKVIVSPKEEVPDTSYNTTVGKKNLYSLDVDMSGFIFNRNEINER